MVIILYAAPKLSLIKSYIQLNLEGKRKHFLTIEGLSKVLLIGIKELLGNGAEQ